MNSQQARIEALLDDLADMGITTDTEVGLDTQTELAGLGYDLDRLDRDLSDRSY